MRALVPLLFLVACSQSSGGSDAGAEGGSSDDGGTTGDGSTMPMMEAGAEAGSGCNPMMKNACASGLWCVTSDCTTGTCMAAPGASDAKQPVCGCDGVTYWNASVAAGAGASQRAAGACTMTALTCAFMGAPCPMGAHCALDVGMLAGCSQQSPAGICWGLPATCPQSGDKRRPCSKPTGQCPFECEAMKMSSPYWADPKCP